MSSGPRQLHSVEWSYRLQAVIDSPGEGISAELEAHLRGCEHCRGEFARLRRADASLLGLRNIALDERFDRRVLDQVQELDQARIAARRALAERQHADRSEALARQWRRTRHLLGARVVAVLATLLAATIFYSGSLSAAALHFENAYRAVLAEPGVIAVTSLVCITGAAAIAWLLGRWRSA